ncbi:MAG: 50S ribosomal protein L24e, partial [Thermoprotei archaeon]
LVKNDGSFLYFCSSKCFKTYQLGRDPKRTPWSKYFLGKKSSRA